MRRPALAIIADRLPILVALLALSICTLCSADSRTPASRPAAAGVSTAEPTAPAASGDRIIKRTLAHPEDTTGHPAPSVRDPVSITRVVLALALVVVLIFFLKWVGKRFFGVDSGARSTRAVRVITRSAIAPRQQLMLIHVGRRVILAANCGTQISTLSEIKDAEEVSEILAQVRMDSGDSIAKQFGTLFHREEKIFASPMRDRVSLTGSAPETDNPDAAETETTAPDSGDESSPISLGETRSELTGLVEKVRMLSQQFRRS